MPLKENERPIKWPPEADRCNPHVNVDSETSDRTEAFPTFPIDLTAFD
jgi:hypothetical protein